MRAAEVAMLHSAPSPQWTTMSAPPAALPAGLSRTVPETANDWPEVDTVRSIVRNWAVAATTGNSSKPPPFENSIEGGWPGSEKTVIRSPSTAPFLAWVSGSSAATLITYSPLPSATALGQLTPGMVTTTAAPSTGTVTAPNSLSGFAGTAEAVGTINSVATIMSAAPII